MDIYNYVKLLVVYILFHNLFFLLPGVPVTSASYPYHAHSSNWNPVSRQDSELQSQSSGAAVGGDTTDDNYSSFRPPEPATRPIRPSRSTERSKKGHTGHTSMMGSGSAAVAAASKNRENTQFIPRPKIPLDPYNLATNNPAKFAEKLFAKLSKVEDEQAKDSKLRGKIIICNFISCFFIVFFKHLFKILCFSSLRHA